MDDTKEMMKEIEDFRLYNEYTEKNFFTEVIQPNQNAIAVISILLKVSESNIGEVFKDKIVATMKEAIDTLKLSIEESDEGE